MATTQNKAVNLNEDDGKYIPGVCNIGPAEMRKRLNQIYPSLALMVIAVVLIEVLHANHLWRFAIILPGITSSLAYLQWHYKFCVGFGMKGIFNFGDLGKTFTADQQEYFKKDRAKAMKIIWISIIFSCVLAAAYYLLVP